MQAHEIGAVIHKRLLSFIHVSFSVDFKKNSLYYKSEQIRVNIAPETLNFPRIQDGEAVLLLNVSVVSPDSTGAKNVSFEVSS